MVSRNMPPKNCVVDFGLQRLSPVNLGVIIIPGKHRSAVQSFPSKLYFCGHKTPFRTHKSNLPNAGASERLHRCFAWRKMVRNTKPPMYPSMKNQRTKYIKVRMTPEEVQVFKEKSASYSSVSHYIRSALAEYSNISTKRQLELMNELGLFYRKYQNELSWAGGNLNQSVKRANELAVAGLLAPSYIQEVLLPVILETQDTLNQIKKDLDSLTQKAVRI